MLGTILAEEFFAAIPLSDHFVSVSNMHTNNCFFPSLQPSPLVFITIPTSDKATACTA